MYHIELFSYSLMVSLICIGHFALLASTFLFSDVSPMSFISFFSKGKAFKLIIFFYRNTGIEGYKIFRSYRQGKRSGVDALYAREWIECEEML